MKNKEIIEKVVDWKIQYKKDWIDALEKALSLKDEKH